ncbi:MAG TPA: hypothetical protein VKH34_16985 [Vicinamibacterales bacterium]|nr:hypothetical protein [Vicinamibacterales bacterium]
MLFAARLRLALILPVLPVVLLGCAGSGGLPELKGTGVFIHVQASGMEIEVPKLGTLGQSYGPRLYPEIPDYDIPAVPDVGPIYVNIPNFPVSTLEGIEWHGYRLGGNTPPGSRSTATVADWKAVKVTAEPTKVAGLFKIVVAAADAKTGRWKPELNHEYFGITTGSGVADKTVWAVRIK